MEAPPARPGLNDTTELLKEFSSNLRRDFLGNLVRLLARAISVKTVRKDWRTRDGMIRFLDRYSTRLREQLEEDTFIKFFCANFQLASDALSDRGFVMYLGEHWTSAKGVLNSAHGRGSFILLSLMIRGALDKQNYTGWPLDWTSQQIKRLVEDYIEEKRQRTDVTATLTPLLVVPGSSLGCGKMPVNESIFEDVEDPFCDGALVFDAGSLFDISVFSDL